MNPAAESTQAGHGADNGADGDAYEPPALTVLGTLAELTQLGTRKTDELLSDGSRA